MIRHQGQLLLAYRESHTDLQNFIQVVALDANHQPIGAGRRLVIPPAVPEQSCWEDPRLFHFRERLFCSFSYWVPAFGNNRTAVGVCELGANLEVLAVRYPRYGFNHNACTGGDEQGQEKNWVFFEHEGKLHFIYKTVPFDVVEYDFDRDLIGRTARSVPDIDWIWGEIRGSTPPIRVDDRLVSFFHSSLRHQGRMIYFAGVLTFLPQKPFRIHEISALPLLAGRYESGCDKSVIYPGGAVFEDGWRLACGVNDRRCAIIALEHDEVCHALHPVNSGPTINFEGSADPRKSDVPMRLNERRPRLPSENILFLLTPQHSGTHYVRMLLESHSQIGWCISESRCVDEVRLDEYFMRFLRGEGGLVRVLDRFEKMTPGRLEQARRSEFAELGLALPPKREEYRLFHAHLKRSFRGIDLTGLKIVVSLRHPLLAILTALRRQSNIDDLLFAMKCALQLKAHFVPVDLPGDKLGLFESLKLEPEDATRTYLAKEPIVNRTLLEGEPHPKHNFSLATHHDPAIPIARQLLVEERRIHPILLSFWTRLERDGTLEKLQRFGYNFAELRPARQ